MQRRQLLTALGVGGAGAIAGCIGDSDDGGDPGTDGDDDDSGPDDDGDDDPSGSVHVEGQSFRMPIPDRPDEMHFLWEHGDRSGHETELEAPRVWVFPAVTTIPTWSRWIGPYDATPEDQGFLQLYESYEITEDTISVTIRDDMYWNDGEPVRAYDAIAQVATWQWPHEEYGYQPPPAEAHIMHSPGSFTMPDGPDGKTYELHAIDTPEWDEVGGFHLDYSGVAFWLAGWLYPRLGPVWPSHRDPYQSLADDAVADFEEQNPDAPSHTERISEFITEEDIRNYTDPSMSVTYGAWQIDEVVGTSELVLVPNEHHPNADQLNFDEVILEFSGEDSRTQGSLMSERLDYASLSTPPEVSESMPDLYDEVTSPAGGGYTIALDHDTWFGDVNVRQAMMYALDTEAIAQNIHPTAVAPIFRPGGDVWAVDAVLEDDWIEENLISYEQDLDRADELMEAAGWERQSGVWAKDGETIETILATASDPPVMEETVADQLGSWGMEIQPQLFDDATYADRWPGLEANEEIGEGEGRGAFDVWAGDWASDAPAGFFDGSVTFWWNANARTMQYRARNYYPHEAQEEAAARHADGGAVQGQYDVWQELFIDIPPLGEPDGEPEPFNAAYTFGRVNNGPYDPEDPQPDNEYYNPPHDERHEENATYYWGLAAWTINWWLPVLPLALEQDQHFLNTTNWLWPQEIGGEANEAMWEYFGTMPSGNDVHAYHGMGGRIMADPDNPKPDANVVEE